MCYIFCPYWDHLDPDFCLLYLWSSIFQALRCLLSTLSIQCQSSKAHFQDFQYKILHQHRSFPFCRDSEFMSFLRRSHQRPYQGDCQGIPEVPERRRSFKPGSNRKDHNHHRNHSLSSLKDLNLDSIHGQKRMGLSKVLLVALGSQTIQAVHFTLWLRLLKGFKQEMLISNLSSDLFFD